MLIEKGYYIDDPLISLCYRQSSPVHIAIIRVSTHYDTMKERVLFTSPRQSVFDKLENAPSRISIFDRLGPKGKSIRHLLHERLTFP